MVRASSFNFDADGNLLVGGSVTTNVEARAATADGLTTGIVSDNTDFVQVTSADANNIITLPTPAVGRKVSLRNGATGYELRSNAPATVGINGGAGVAAESAIPANTLVNCDCDTLTTWICDSRSTAGAITATQVAAP